MCQIFIRHDLYTSDDLRIKRLMARYGREAKCIFWEIIELLARTAYEDLSLPRMELAPKFIARLLGGDCSPRLVSHVIRDFGLFVLYEEGGKTFFYSERLEEEFYKEVVAPLVAKREKEEAKRSEGKRSYTVSDKVIKQRKEARATKKRDEIDERNADEMGTKSSRNADEIPPYIRLEDNKTKREREGTSAQRFVPPTQEEVEVEVKERGYTIDPARFFHHYQSNGWMVGANRMTDWRASLAGWQAREEANASKGSADASAPARSKNASERLGDGYADRIAAIPPLEEQWKRASSKQRALLRRHQGHIYTLEAFPPLPGDSDFTGSEVA